MERTVLLAAATWITGAGAWAVGVGFAVAPYIARPGGRLPDGGDGAEAAIVMQADRDDVEVMPAARPPRELSAPAEPLPQQADSDSLLRPPSQLEDASALLSESQRRRLAPVNSLRRKRRSRKLRVVGADVGDKFVPIVPGARATQDEAIMNSFSAETLSVKREQGEDYWVDPVLVQSEIQRKEEKETSRRARSEREGTFTPDRLKKEIAAPYKNNVIGTIVLGIGVVGVVFALFPSLLDNNVATSIATFPDTL